MGARHRPNANQAFRLSLAIPILPRHDSQSTIFSGRIREDARALHPGWQPATRERARDQPGGASLVARPGGAESEGLIVLDLASGRALRRLSGSAAVGAHPGRTAIVGFEPLMEWPKKAGQNGAP